MKRKEPWKWSPEIDELLKYYKNKHCECGCGKKLNPSRKQVRDSKYKNCPLRVLKGHHNRLPEAQQWIKAGEDHPMYGRKGKLAPGWKGGLGKKRTCYGKGWATARRHTLKRDWYICQICGTKRKKRRIDVHHIVPFKLFKNHVEANHLENLISLCYKCHQIVEWRIKDKENGVNCKNIQNGQFAAKLKDYARLLEGSTVRTEETIMSISAPLERDDMT